MKAPVWLNEGLAIYEAREWTFFRISILTRASLTDRLIPLPVLTLSFPAEEEPAELAYAESFMFIVSWIPIITSVSMLWFLVALIFVYGYARKKRQANRRLKEMETEEESEEWHPNG